MIHIQKGEEPEFMLEFKKKNPKKIYDSEEFAPYRDRLREILVKEQKYICAYCCARIDEDKSKSHNEHIEPRNPGKYQSKKSLDYYNIVASCNNKNTCGKAKGSKYEADKFVSPLLSDCEDKFDYCLDGLIEGDKYTIDEVLNLNEYELRNARRNVLRYLQSMDKETIKEVFMNNQEEYPPYYNVIKWYYNSL